VLVTVFGTASQHARADLDPSLSPAAAARHVFVVAADRSFWTATGFLVATWLLVTFAIRTRKPEVEAVAHDPRRLEPAPSTE
ncbi:MAG: hypothetical protein ACRDVG_08025, partial [Jatrophihabitantaceae bacterium]